MLSHNDLKTGNDNDITVTFNEINMIKEKIYFFT